jgi:hypothetical protein
MGYKRAVAILAALYVVGRAIQFFNKKKPPSRVSW